jgi:hypothetical protein
MLKKLSKKNSKKSSNKSTNLYTDDNPKTTIKGTGFANKESAEKTLDLIKHRSLGYQFAIINTLYNRAKFHPNRSNEMFEAMKVFATFIAEYKKLKTTEEQLYPFLPLDIIKSYEKLAQKYKISEVARGIKKSTKTDMGFFQILTHITHPNKLQFIPIKQSNPKGEDYWSYRINFIKARLGQMKATNTPLFYTEGKYKDLPTKQYLILIIHGFSPLGNKLKKFNSNIAY